MYDIKITKNGLYEPKIWIKKNVSFKTLMNIIRAQDSKTTKIFVTLSKNGLL